MSADVRLLYVFPEPLPLPRARGVQVAHFVRALAEIGIKITLAYVPSGKDHPFVPIGHPVPMNVQLLPISRGLPWPLHQTGVKSHRLFMLRLGRWIKSRSRAGDAPDIVFFRHVKAAAQFSASFPNLPYIYEAHELFAETAKPSQRNRLRVLEGKVLKHACLILANSQGSALGISTVYGLDRHVVVLPNGVDYLETVPSKDWDDIHRRIIYAGSLFGWKGVDDLVLAARELPECEITIVGGSPEQVSRLQAMHGGVGASLIFTGQLPQYEVQRRLAQSCIAVLPNRPDKDSSFTSPLKLFEYMACGCAIVATDLPAVREVLGDSNAFWAEAGDPQSLAAAIRNACKLPERASQMAAEGRVLVRTRTWVGRARQLLDLINSMLKFPGHRP